MSDVFTEIQEVLVTHANARLNVHGRRLLIARVIGDGRPVAHVAKELGVSRQCAHRWIARYRTEGEAGLVDRSSRPPRCPRRTPAEVESRVLQLRAEQRRGQDWIGPELGVPARTVSAILRRHQVPLPARVRPADRAGHPCQQVDRGALCARPPRIAGPHGRQEGRPDT